MTDPLMKAVERAKAVGPWSRKAELDLTMRRMGGERNLKAPAFWPGRPNLYASECPIIADGELLYIAHRALGSIAEAQTEMIGALTTHHDVTDRYLQTTQEKLREAIAEIETLRQRIIGAGEVLDAIEAASSAPDNERRAVAEVG